MATRKSLQRRRRSNGLSRGFSLLEALIAVLLLSVGAMGVAALQIVSLRNSQLADGRERVASLAMQMTERAQLSPSQVKLGAAALTGPLDSFSCAGTATTEIEAWRRQLDCEVPGSRGGVSYNAQSNRLIVELEWNDAQGAGGGNSAQRMVLESRL